MSAQLPFVVFTFELVFHQNHHL